MANYELAGEANVTGFELRSSDPLVDTIYQTPNYEKNAGLEILASRLNLLYLSELLTKILFASVVVIGTIEKMATSPGAIIYQILVTILYTVAVVFFFDALIEIIHPADEVIQKFLEKVFCSKTLTLCQWMLANIRLFTCSRMIWN